MFKALFAYVKYPSVAGIISAIWLGTMVLILSDPELPVVRLVVINIVVSLFIGFIGFRVDKK